MDNVKTYIDIDRTVFDTAKATDIIWGKLGELYGVDSALENSRQREFYVYSDDNTYHYDFAAHLIDIGKDPDEVAAQLISSDIADDRLLLPGAKEFIDTVSQHNDSEFLTYGNDYFQILKVALCPAMGGLAVNVILSPKAEFLSDKPNCNLVDDKPIGDTLPDTVNFYQVQLEEKKKLDEPWPVYTSLSDVSDLIIPKT